MNASTFRKNRLATAKKATIKIHRLRLRTFIGFNPEENALRFADSVSLTLEYEAEDGANLRHLEKVS